MKSCTLTSLAVLFGFILAVLIAIGAFIWSGLYNVAADVPHSEPVFALLETVRDRSIERRAQAIEPPDLTDPELVRQGAGNYAAMCVVCHLAPGMPETELARGLYPAPPALARARVDPARAFWVIKHGIKATGMPAWGKSMADEYIWGMAAFLQQLPNLDAAAYRELVRSSSGHSHGGGETAGHEHAEDSATAREEPSGTPAPHDHPAGDGDGDGHDHHSH